MPRLILGRRVSIVVGKRQLAFARQNDPATDKLYVKEGQHNVLLGVA